MSYQPNVPTGTVPLNQDYLNLQGNFSSLDTQWKVDHVPLTNVSGVPPAGTNGCHTSIHMVPQTVITNVTGLPQLYSKSITDVNTDEALFLNTGTGNRTVQMTVPIVPVWDAINNRGFSFLPGGFIYQWGFTGLISNGATVTYGQPFSSAVYNVQISARGSAATGSMFVTSVASTANFTFGITGGGSAQIFWTAIGT